MKFYDEQLQKLQEQIARKRQLEAKVSELRTQRSTLSTRVRELEAIKMQEHEVDKAQFEGHAKYCCLITTSRGEKLTYGSFEILPRNVFITKQPENVSANAGDTVRFSIVAEGSVQPFTYEWQMKNKSMAGYGAIPQNAEWAKGQKTPELSSVVFPADFEDEVQYRCKITDAEGVTRYSNPVTVTEKQEKSSGMIVIMD